jgi:preprotein translocase subunit SecF
MKPGKIIGFYKKRWIFFGVSLSIMIIGLIFTFAKGITFDIQFTGGALLSYTYDGEVDENLAADIATQQLGRPVSTQLSEDLATGEKKLVFNIAGKYGVDAADQSKLDDALKAQFPDNQLKLSSAQMVEKFFGDQFMRKGIIALVLSTVLILCYVWIRFHLMGGLSAGVMAVVALIRRFGGFLHQCYFWTSDRR